jgi:hypothetical protein
VGKFALLLMIALALQTQTAFTQELPELPPATPTARDLYIGCSLFIRSTEVAYTDKHHAPPYSAIACSLTALMAFGYSRKIKPGNEWEYCVPENADWAAEPGRVLATRYVESYEHYRFPDPNKQGLTMMLYLFKLAWPCPKSK